jgi:hypothetical protein
MSHRTIFEPDNHERREGVGGQRESEQGATLPQRYENNRQLAAFFARQMGYDPQGGLVDPQAAMPKQQADSINRHQSAGTVSADAPRSEGVVQGSQEGYNGPLTNR